MQRVKMPSNLGRKNSFKRYLQFMSLIVKIPNTISPKRMEKNAFSMNCSDATEKKAYTHVLMLSIGTKRIDSRFKRRGRSIEIGRKEEDERTHTNSQTHSHYKLCSKH